MANDQEDTAIEDVAAGEDTKGETPDAPDESPAAPQRPGAAGPLAGAGGMAGTPPYNIPGATPPFLPPQQSPSQTIQQRHGGLLTGLAGALIDGIAGGMAQTPQAAQQMPLTMQTMAQKYQESQLAQMRAQEDMQLEPARAKAQAMQMQIDSMQIMHALWDVHDDTAAGVTQAQRKLLNEGESQGWAEPKASGMTLEGAKAAHQEMMRTGDPDALYTIPYAEGHDENGNPISWGLMYLNPHKLTNKDVSAGIDIKDKDGKLVNSYTATVRAGLPGDQAYSLAVDGVKDQLTAVYGKQAQQMVSGTDATGKFVTMPAGQAQAQGGLRNQFPVSSKQLSDWQDAAVQTDTFAASLGRYESDFQTLRPKLSDKANEALRVLTTHQDQVAHNLLDIPQSAIMDIITKEPMSGYSERLMKGTMTQDQYRDLGFEGQKLAADYFHAIVANMNYQRARQKGQVRNQAIIEADMQNIPLPYLDQGSAQASFNNANQDMQRFRTTIPSNIRGLDMSTVATDEGGSAAPAAPTGGGAGQATQAGQPGERPVTVNGKIVGYTTDGKTMRPVQ